MLTPEELASQYVNLPSDEPIGGQHHITLVTPSGKPVVLGPFPNPALAREKCEAVREFVADAIRQSCK